jgi:hypothetical protein
MLNPRFFRGFFLGELFVKLSHFGITFVGFVMSDLML